MSKSRQPGHSYIAFFRAAPFIKDLRGKSIGFAQITVVAGCQTGINISSERVPVLRRRRLLHSAFYLLHFS